MAYNQETDSYVATIDRETALKLLQPAVTYQQAANAIYHYVRTTPNIGATSIDDIVQQCRALPLCKSYRERIGGVADYWLNHATSDAIKYYIDCNATAKLGV